MSDEFVPPAIAEDAHAPRPAGFNEYYCEYPGCGKWGGWGFGRSKQQTEWFCYEHVPAQQA